MERIEKDMNITQTFEFDAWDNLAAQEILAKKGYVTLEMENISDDPERYAEILADGKRNNTHGHLVWAHSAEELSDGRMLFATKDDGVCISICPDGDVCSFVRNTSIKPERKGIIPTAMMNVLAVKTAGPKHTECYGEKTTRAYEALGFKVIGYYEWAKEDQPDDWPDWDNTKPNMYFLIHNGESAAEIAEKYGTFKQSTDEELKALPNFGPKWCKEIYDYSAALRRGETEEAERIYAQKRASLENEADTWSKDVA